MGLLVRSLALRNWRSFSNCELMFGEGLTVLHGANAVGKTNTIEALQMLTAGSSFRRPKVVQLLREGTTSGCIDMRIEGDGRVIDMRCLLEEGKRRFERNGKRCAPHDVPSTLMSVLFTPDDLQLVKRGASLRRDELDSFARQANRGYAKVLSAYQRSVEQRNRLLKEPHTNLSLLDAWDASVALGGATVLHARLRLFTRLREHIQEIYQGIGGGEELSCSYVCSLGEHLEDASREELCERLGTSLTLRRQEDLARQQTTTGPHRDDIAFTLNGRDARSFASQGQQRSIVLAWKLAEVSLSHELVGQRPLLLLDDVMSELDEKRREAVTRLVQEGTQTVVTTTNLGYFPQELLAAAEVIDIAAQTRE